MLRLTKSMSANKERTPFSNYFKYNWPSIIWAAFVLWACLRPKSTLPEVNIPNIDKLVHFASYFVLAGLLGYGWIKQKFIAYLHRHTVFKIMIVAALYGLFIEISQEQLTTDRHFSWIDELANITGAGAGLLALNYLSQLRT